MQLAFIRAKVPGSVDVTLGAIVQTLSAEGVRLIGVIQEPSGRDRHRCDMNLIEIANGKRLSISQSLGKGASGCRLDPHSIETIAWRVARDLRDNCPDLLIINRFGKLEATGRGFCPVIADALGRDVPVLVGVNDLNRSDFAEFAAGLAFELPDELGSVLAWARPLLRKAAA